MRLLVPMIVMGRHALMGVLMLMIMGMAVHHIPVPVLMLMLDDLGHRRSTCPTPTTTTFTHIPSLLKKGRCHMRHIPSLIAPCQKTSPIPSSRTIFLPPWV
ncbi:hypothetical protein TDMWS_08140 [Thermodesulfomicrobium sp. WS]|nr:hypothetical protein TDMWS_08140 [Thermodesulfomicrobium sp. WS]